MTSCMCVALLCVVFCLCRPGLTSFSALLLQCAGPKSPANRALLLETINVEHYTLEAVARTFRYHGYSPSTPCVFDAPENGMIMGPYSIFEHTAHEVRRMGRGWGELS